MKYAFMSFSTPKLTLKEMLTLARELGYDGIEPRLDAGHAHGVEVAAEPDERDKIRRAADEGGVALACLAVSCQFADPAQAPTMIAEAHERIDLAGDVGAPRLRVFGGAFPENVTREQAVEQVAGSLRALADHAAERGVTVCMETHDAWCDPRHVAEVMKRVDHPAVAVNWDALHPVREGLATIDESFEALRPWIRHLHVHDALTPQRRFELVPMGEGVADHKRVIELLKTISFDGYLSGEWIDWEPHETHLPRELATLKGYERDLR